VRVLAVFVLVLLNASLLLWQFYRPQSSQALLPATAAGVPELRLVNEGPTSDHASVCRALGPFADAGEAKVASERFLGFGLHPRTQVATRNESWFRVILGPLASPTAAQVVADDLRSQGVHDVQLLGDEDAATSVSLGLYRDRAGAEQRTAELANLGHSARIETVDHTAEAYWVSVDATAAEALSPAQLASAGAGRSGVALTPRPCP